jgi:hypothetical protein
MCSKENATSHDTKVRMTESIKQGSIKMHISNQEDRSVPQKNIQQSTEHMKVPTTPDGATVNTENKNSMMDTTENGDELLIKCGTFNCHGLKQSMDYVIQQLSNRQILCLCETWLRPGELDLIDSLILNNPKLQGKNYKTFSKSSMQDISPDYTGRPFGGVTIICELSNNLTFHELATDSERIIAIGVCDPRGSIVQIITSVYMPFYQNGNLQQTELFVETLDALQSLLDKYGSLAPIKLCGDFNAKLPVRTKLNKQWYKRNGYTKHSKLLYDFLSANNLISCDLESNPADSFTYFCIKNNTYTWIDHVISTEYDAKSIQACTILPLDENNVSDHLPINFELKLKICGAGTAQRPTPHIHQSPLNWKSCYKNEKYRSILEGKLNKIPQINISMNTEFCTAQQVVDDYLMVLNQAMRDAAKEAGCYNNTKWKPKAYWCPELNALRDQKHFWWTLWCQNGRPRTGAVYGCWKNIKKTFRRVSRKFAQKTVLAKFHRINGMFQQRKMRAFWNTIKRSKKQEVNSSLKSQDFADHFSEIMKDNQPLNTDQEYIKRYVQEKFSQNQNHKLKTEVTTDTVNKLIGSLKRNSAPGIDNITAEHMIYGKSPALYLHLASLYSAILSWSIVPGVFQTGIVIPILKKSTLNPNVASNYRPITLSSVHSKMIELLLIPQDEVNECQFGFRSERGTSMGCAFLNDVIHYFNGQGSPVYVCSLDAEKCFDKIWHAGLMFKLWNVLPLNHWLLLYRWYSMSKALVKWDSTLSEIFPITQGVRQGSVLSPYLFNIFIDGMLNKIQTNKNGLRIGKDKYNCFAYADDVTIFSSTAPGLQCLIDICTEYASLWRFRFGVNKSKCMIAGESSLKVNHKWYLGNECMENTNSLEILGNVFSQDGSSKLNIDKRIKSCRQSYYSLQAAGMCYKALETNTKVHLWKTVCLPTLLYGCDALKIDKSDLNRLNSIQGTLMKNALGIGKRSHHSSLIQALHLDNISEVINWNTLCLFYRSFRLASPLRTMCNFLLSKYITVGKVYKGTLLSKIIDMGYSPTDSAYNLKKTVCHKQKDGVVESLEYLVNHENFMKDGSSEHVLATLITRAF